MKEEASLAMERIGRNEKEDGSIFGKKKKGKIRKAMKVHWKEKQSKNFK